MLVFSAHIGPQRQDHCKSGYMRGSTDVRERVREITDAFAAILVVGVGNHLPASIYKPVVRFCTSDTRIVCAETEAYRSASSVPDRAKTDGISSRHHCPQKLDLRR